MVTASQLSYPAVAVTNYGYVYGVEGPSELERCNSTALKKGHFRELWTADNEGRQYLAKGYANPRVVSGGILRRILRGPMVQVDLDLTLGDIMTLEEAKAELSKVVIRNPEMWQASAEDEQILDRIQAAQSFRDLYRLFSEI